MPSQLGAVIGVESPRSPEVAEGRGADEASWGSGAADGEFAIEAGAGGTGEVRTGGCAAGGTSLKAGADPVAAAGAGDPVDAAADGALWDADTTEAVAGGAVVAALRAVGAAEARVDDGVADEEVAVDGSGAIAWSSPPPKSKNQKTPATSRPTRTSTPRASVHLARLRGRSACPSRRSSSFALDGGGGGGGGGGGNLLFIVAPFSSHRLKSPTRAGRTVARPCSVGHVP